jgi:hypothetical protein
LSSAYLTQRYDLQFHPFFPAKNSYNFILLYCWIIFHLVCMPHFVYRLLGI